MLGNDSFIDQLIACQRRAIQYYVFMGIGLAVLGVLLILAAFVLSSTIIPDAFKTMVGIGGTLVTSLSAIPIKEILARKEKADIFYSLKNQLQMVKQQAGPQGEAESTRIEDLMWEVAKKIALG